MWLLKLLGQGKVKMMVRKMELFLADGQRLHLDIYVSRELTTGNIVEVGETISLRNMRPQ